MSRIPSKEFCKHQIIRLINLFTKNRDEFDDDKTTKLIMFSSKIWTCILKNIKSESILYATLYNLFVEQFDENAFVFIHFIQTQNIQSEMEKGGRKKMGEEFFLFLHFVLEFWH